jgi:hypothetical protein
MDLSSKASRRGRQLDSLLNACANFVVDFYSNIFGHLQRDRKRVRDRNVQLPRIGPAVNADVHLAPRGKRIGTGALQDGVLNGSALSGFVKHFGASDVQY